MTTPHVCRRGRRVRAVLRAVPLSRHRIAVQPLKKVCKRIAVIAVASAVAVAVAGVADNMIVLTKQKRADEVTKMSVTGRDISYEEYPLTFDGQRGLWKRQSDSFDDFMAKTEIEVKRAAYSIGNTRKTILKLLEENGGVWRGSCGSIIAKSKEYGTPISATSQKLGFELAEINGFLYEDGILHTEIDNGEAAKKHKFERLNV